MSKNLRSDIKAQGLVLRRTNYGEADRILNIITPEGKIAVIARGARRARSKLAGGVEMFTLVELTAHFGRSEIGVLTSVKMKKYYGEIVKDLGKLEIASMMIKKVNIAAEGVDTADFFSLLNDSLNALDTGMRASIVEIWFLVNLKRIHGEEINLYRDGDGKKLIANARYDWNKMDKVFTLSKDGMFGANEIKLMRLMTINSLGFVRRIIIDDRMAQRVLEFVKSI